MDSSIGLLGGTVMLSIISHLKFATMFENTTQEFTIMSVWHNLFPFGRFVHFSSLGNVADGSSSSLQWFGEAKFSHGAPSGMGSCSLRSKTDLVPHGAWALRQGCLGCSSILRNFLFCITVILSLLEYLFGAKLFFPTRILYVLFTMGCIAIQRCLPNYGWCLPNYGCNPKWGCGTFQMGYLKIG